MPKRITIKDYVFSQDPYSNLLKSIDEQNILDVSEILPLITPGSQLRAGLDEILCAETGAIIVLGTNDILENLIRGGIKVDAPYNHSVLFELAKMDGAIILSNDLSKILFANIHLMPDKSIPSTETGIRHRSAQQVAVETNRPVISISKRRKIISLFYKNKKYVLQDLNLLLVRANYLLDHLSKYREQVDAELNKFDCMELDKNINPVKEAIIIIQKILYFFRFVQELETLIVELGSHGKEISQGLYENSIGLDETLFYLLKDHSSITDDSKIQNIISTLNGVDLKTLINDNKLSEIISIPLYEENTQKKKSRGYRILSKTSIIYSDLNNLINRFGSIININQRTAEELSEKGAINIALAKNIKQRLKEIAKK